MTLNFVNESSLNMPKSYLEKTLKIFFNILGKKIKNKNFRNLEMSLVFLDPKPAQKLNLKYRKKNYPTDVLSFTGITPSLGELIMCPQVLVEQAKEQGHSFRKETLYMAIHGTLHLLGYDHETNKKEAEQMFRLQEEMFIKTLHKLKK